MKQLLALTRKAASIINVKRNVKKLNVVPSQEFECRNDEIKVIFEIDDLVVLEDALESNLAMIKNENRLKIGQPQRIVKIEVHWDHKKGTNISYHLDYIGNVVDYSENFRLANDKEIKEQKIKNIFLLN